MKKIIFLILLALALNSCEQIQEGTVMAKWVEPERTYTTTSSHRHGKSTSWSTHVHHDDTDWVIRFKGKLDGEYHTRQIYVLPEVYGQLKIGDHFKVDDNCSIWDSPN